MGKFILYVFWLLYSIALSTWQVLLVIWRPWRHYEPGFMTVKHTPLTSAETTLYAHSITLTPGTLTVASHEDALFVHALDMPSQKGLMQGEVEQAIQALRCNKC